MDQVRTVTDKPRDDDHQHAHARRSHRQQRVLPGVSRSRRPGEHARPTWRRWTPSRATKAQVLPDLTTYKDKPSRCSRVTDQIDLLLRRRSHQRRQHRRLLRRFASHTRATCSHAKRHLSSTSTSEGVEWRIRKPKKASHGITGVDQVITGHDLHDAVGARWPNMAFNRAFLTRRKPPSSAAGKSGGRRRRRRVRRCRIKFAWTTT